MEEKRQNNTIKKVLKYVKKYWGLLLFSIVLAFVSVLLSLYIPILVGDTIDEILGMGQVNFIQVKRLLIGSLILAVITALCQWIMNIINNKITFQVIRDMRKEAFAKIQELPLKYVDTHPYGEIVSKIIADVDQFADGLLMGFTQLFTGVVTIIGTLVFMFSIHWKIAIVVVVLTPISLFVARFIAKRTYNMFRVQSEYRGEQTSLIDEMVGNQKVVQAYTQEEEILEKFDDINEKLSEASLKATFFSSLTNPCTRFVNSIVYAAVGLSGALSAMNGGITVGALSCFLSYANQYTKPFNEISGVITEL